jgi:hypothetical protein
MKESLGIGDDAGEAARVPGPRGLRTSGPVPGSFFEEIYDDTYEYTNPEEIDNRLLGSPDHEFIQLLQNMIEGNKS